MHSLGVPAPGEGILVVTAVFAARTHRLDIAGVIATAAVAAFLGTSLGYLFGRSAGFLLSNNARRRCFGRSRLIVAILPRHRAVGGQDLVSLPGDLREIARRRELFERGLGLAELSLSLSERSLRLGYLLIEVRRLDIGQLLAGAHAIADVHVTPLQITSGARENVGFRKRRDVSR